MNQLILFGCIGGILPDVLRFVKNRYEPAPMFYKFWTFWLGLLFLVALGGFSAWLGGATEVKQALAYGFAAPEIISKVLSKPGGADRGARFDLREWWSA